MENELSNHGHEFKVLNKKIFVHEDDFYFLNPPF